jgi:hypothetical protein
MGQWGHEAMGSAPLTGILHPLADSRDLPALEFVKLS